MDQSSEDEELQRAIALSLGRISSSPTAPSRRAVEVVDLTEDSDGPDPGDFAVSRDILNSVVASTIQGQQNTLAVTSDNDKPEIPEQRDSLGGGSVFGIAGLDRKKMEEERLARLNKKRKLGSSSSEPLSGPSLQPKVSKTAAASSPGLASRQAATAPQRLEFPNGAIKQTWAFGQKRENDIKIEEVLQKSDLELAVLSSFQWNFEWLFRKFNTATTRFMLVIGAKDEEYKEGIQKDFETIPNVRLCLPRMDGQINCMHSKLMLLFHPQHLRVVLPSANLVPYDWGEQGGFMENMVFLIDLPRKAEGSANEPENMFLQELKHFMLASGFHANIISKLDEWDFSQTSDMAFVHTIGGSHVGDYWQRTGHCGLGRAVNHLGLATSGALKLDYVTSSIGNLNEQFMRSMYLAAQGDTGLKELTLRTSKSFPTDKYGVAVSGTEGRGWKDNMSVYFPSLKTVKESKGGTQDAGTICFQSKWFASASFPKQVMRDCIPTRPGMLMHSKILLARPNTGIPHPKDKSRVCRGWAYVGSANLSESAWGRLVADRTTKRPKLNCRNWESGVLVPVYSSTAVGIQDDDLSNTTDAGIERKQPDAATPAAAGDLTDTFRNRIPVPMQIPGPTYESRQSRPWYWMEDY